MSTKNTVIVLVALAVVGLGYIYYSGNLAENKSEQTVRSVDDAIAALERSGDEETTIVTGDDGDLQAMEAQSAEIMSQGDVYVQGEF